MRRLAIQLVVLLVWACIFCSPCSGQSKRIPDASGFLKMPYDRITVGIIPELENTELKKIPRLHDGEIIVLSRGLNDTPQFLSTTGLAEFYLQQPQSNIFISTKGRSAEIFLGTISRDLIEVASEGGIHVQHANQELTQISSHSVVKGIHGTSVLQQKKQFGAELSSVVKSRQKQISEAGQMQISNTTSTTEEDHAESGLQLAQSDKLTAMGQGAADQYGVALDAEMNMIKRSDILLGKLATLLAGEVSVLGKHGSLDDYDTLQILLGESFLDAFIEMAFNLIGISEFDSVEAIVDERYIPTVEEITEFTETLLRNGDLSQLLNRPFSSGFTSLDAGVQKTVSNIETAYAFLPDELYHGATGILVTSFTNKSSVPIYDMLVVLAVPKNTTFNRFLNQTPYEKGYLNEFIPGKNQLVMKLYKPILPGETFTNMTVLSTAKWTAETELN